MDTAKGNWPYGYRDWLFSAPVLSTMNWPVDDWYFHGKRWATTVENGKMDAFIFSIDLWIDPWTKTVFITFGSYIDSVPNYVNSKIRNAPLKE